MRVALILLVLIALAGCSNKAAYENIQLNKRNQCLKLPPSEYDECMEGVNKSYEEYERERERHMKE